MIMRILTKPFLLAKTVIEAAVFIGSLLFWALLAKLTNWDPLR